MSGKDSQEKVKIKQLNKQPIHCFFSGEKRLEQIYKAH